MSLNKADRLQWLVPRDAFFATLLFMALPLYAVPLVVASFLEGVSADWVYDHFKDVDE